MNDIIPFLPFPRNKMAPVFRAMMPLSTTVLKLFPNLEQDMTAYNSTIEPIEFVSGAVFNTAFYTILIFISLLMMIVMSTPAYQEPGKPTHLEKNFPLVLAFTGFAGGAVMIYVMMYPKMRSGQRKYEMEHDILFAARHLTVQTGAGVPLYESIVSIAEKYGEAQADYGAISDEFRKIVREVRGGRDMNDVMEENAEKNPSQLYRRMMLQLANSSRAGANVSVVLKDIVNTLASEQIIAIRKYGAQLNTLSMFYIFGCIVAPAMVIILLSIAASMMDMPVGVPFFVILLIVMAGVQFMFIGLIKSRRPVVAL